MRPGGRKRDVRRCLLNLSQLIIVDYLSRVILRAMGTKVAQCPPDHLLVVNPSPADDTAVRKPLSCGLGCYLFERGL